MHHLPWLFFSLFISGGGAGAVQILTSISTRVKLLNSKDLTNSTEVPTTLSQAIVALDYHYRRGEFYYSDSLGRIYRGWLRPPDVAVEPIVIAEVKLSDGLCVDWLHDNLYWTDVSRKAVEKATLDGLHRRVLFNSSEGVDKPRAIVLDPTEGVLFWSDWGSNPKVETSGLDGQQKKTIVSTQLFWPNGLALDLSKKQLYILDGFLSTLSCCSYDGSGLRVLVQSSAKVQQSFGLSFYGNILYWGSWRSHSLFSMSVHDTDIQTVYASSGWKAIIERLMGLKAIHPDLQQYHTGAVDPCHTLSCSHGCLVGRRPSATCSCPYGYRLENDGTTCKEEGYLMISWRKSIRRYNLQGSEEEPMLDMTKAAIALDYHLKKQLLFWSDIEEHRIYRAPLSQLNNRTVVATSENCDGIAVDWVHDVLYWTDTQSDKLEAARLDGSNRTVLVSKDLDQPRDIALDPSQGIMFWTDWGKTPKVERAALDGSERTAIATQDLEWPNGLTLDFEEKRVYWVDGKLATITTCLYDGTQRTLLLGPQSIFEQPFAITLLQDNIYWTDWKSKALYKADKRHNITELEKLASSATELLRPNGVIVVHSSLQQDLANPCASLRCQGLCLGSNTTKKARCFGEPISDPEPVEDKMKLDKETVGGSLILKLQTSTPPAMVVISITCFSRLGCTQDENCSEKFKKILVFKRKTEFNVSDLLPASIYSVEFDSPQHNEEFQIITSAPDPPEVPKIIGTAAVQGKSAKIRWTPVDTCVPNFQFYHFSLYKAEAIRNFNTSKSAGPIKEGHTNNAEANFEDLEPGEYYTVRVYTYDPKYFSSISFVTEKDEDTNPECMLENFLCDGKSDCLDGKDEDLTACANIINLYVYKKNTSDVFFRAEVSNGTKKGLEQFRVVSWQDDPSNAPAEVKLLAVPCVVWPDSYCFKVTSLAPKTKWHFNVTATLKSGKVGSSIQVTALTKEEGSGPPEDLQVVNYSPYNADIQWHHPNASNGIIRSFLININEVKTFQSEKCCQRFPIIEMSITDDEPVYIIETGGLLPASTYAVSVTTKTLFISGSAAIEVHTAPPPMHIMRMPNLTVPVAWQPQHSSPDELPDYHSLIRSYMLLVIPPEDHEAPEDTSSDLESLLQSQLKSKIEKKFKVVWKGDVIDKSAFQQPIQVMPHLELGKKYQLVWVQISQYEDAYGLDYIVSDSFVAH